MFTARRYGATELSCRQKVASTRLDHPASCPRGGHETNVAKVVGSVGFYRLHFRDVVRRDDPLPVEPGLPSIRHRVGHLDGRDACSFPMFLPPGCRMQAAHARFPPSSKMIRNGPLDFSYQPGSRDPHRATGFHKSGEIVQIQVVRPVVDERVDADDRIEEVRGERQRPCVRPDREDAILDPGVPNPPEIVRSRTRLPNRGDTSTSGESLREQSLVHRHSISMHLITARDVPENRSATAGLSIVGIV